MRPLPKLLVALLVALFATLLAVLYFSERSAPPRSTELGRLVTRFMDCLPENTTLAARDEIAGILDRFYDRAMAGDVDAQDVVEIEDALRSYVTAGEIPDSLIFGFMSKVGEATRRRE